MGARVAGAHAVRSRVPPFKDQAVCLRVWDWSETSQTAALFCRDAGLLRVIAKGSRRPRAPYSGGLGPLTRGEAAALSKPAQPLSSGESSGLTTLTAWDLQETFPGVRRSLLAFYGAMHIAELLLRLVREGDPHPALFDDALRALRDLDDPAAGLGPVVRLQWSALTHSGHRPEIAHDVATGGPLRRRAVYDFSPQQGGLTDSRAGDRGQVWRVRSATVDYLRRVGAGVAAPADDPRTRARALALLGRYAEFVLGAGLRSLGPLITGTDRAKSPDPRRPVQGR